MCIALILITIFSQLSGPTASFPRPRPPDGEEFQPFFPPSQPQTHAHVKARKRCCGAQPAALKRRPSPSSRLYEGLMKVWNGCQRGLRGNALICEACAELWAGVGRIWSLKQTRPPPPPPPSSPPRLRLHAANFCRRPGPGGWMMAMP
ncbi:Hypothetical predicted protein, partial [Scomber scombrus]